MVSIISIIFDLFRIIRRLISKIKFLKFLKPSDIVVVRRLPSRKVLQAHLLGLTFALLVALLFLCFNYISLTLELPWYAPLLIGLVIIAGTYFGGPFVFIVLLLQLTILVLNPTAGLLWYVPLLIGLIILAGAIIGGPFVLIVVLLQFAILVLSPKTGELIKAMMPLAQWYLVGYAFGFVFAILYNDLIYLYLITFCKDRVKIAFAFDFDKKINIIKSPRQKEELAFQRLLDRKTDKQKERFRRRKAYNYDIDYPDDKNPYTIVFVANPWILKNNEDKVKHEEFIKEANNYDPDPIMKNRELFLQSIDRALYSFQRDEVLGRHEIWSRVRIVAIFDKSLAKPNASGVDFGMLQPYPNILEIDGEIAENLLDPMEEMQKNFQSIVEMGTEKSTGLLKKTLDEIKKKTDVIFAMSASTKYTRSTAHFSDWIESGRRYELIQSSLDYLSSKGVPGEVKDKLQNLLGRSFKGKDNFISAIEAVLGDTDKRQYEDVICESTEKVQILVDGKKFQYTPDPISQNPKGNNIKIASHLKVNDFNSKHDDFANYPGRVALNVLKANTKTLIHEFAHAMSSAYRGAIVDEYFDSIEVSNSTSQSTKKSKTGHEFVPFFINRIEREKQANGKVVPVHKIFSKYDYVKYKSDRNHPTAKEDWLGYFPERQALYTICTMDSGYTDYCWDKLIHDFMYERLIAKINR